MTPLKFPIIDMSLSMATEGDCAAENGSYEVGSEGAGEDGKTGRSN
jgi:hypothetical protein